MDCIYLYTAPRKINIYVNIYLFYPLYIFGRYKDKLDLPRIQAMLDAEKLLPDSFPKSANGKICPSDGFKGFCPELSEVTFDFVACQK